MRNKKIIERSKGLCTFLVFLSVSFIVSAQQTAELDRLVKQIQQEESMRHGSLAVCVHQVNTGKSLYCYYIIIPEGFLI